VRELQVYAHVTGFRGSDRDWLKQYHALARRYGWQVSRGEPQLTQFRTFLDDEAAGSAYCKDSDLARYLEHLTRTPPKLASREELKQKLFKALDYDNSNRLSGDDLRRFAELCGFTGGAEAWANQYSAMCKTFKWRPEDGVGEAAFSQIVDAGGCTNCTNDELFEMAARLEKRPSSPISRGRSLSNMDEGRESTGSPPAKRPSLTAQSPRVSVGQASPVAPAAKVEGLGPPPSTGISLPLPHSADSAMATAQSRPSQAPSPRGQSPRESPRPPSASASAEGFPECPMPPGERNPSDRPLPPTTQAEVSQKSDGQPDMAPAPVPLESSPVMSSADDKSTLPHYPGPPFLPPPSQPSSSAASPYVSAATARPTARTLNSTLSTAEEEHAASAVSAGASPAAQPSSPRARMDSGASSPESPFLKGKGKGKGKPGGMKGKPGASGPLVDDGSPRTAVSAAPMEYTVVLEKVPGMSLGLNIGSTKDGNLLIESVREGCSVHARNLAAEKNGEEQIMPGDEIIAVNGTTAGKPGREGATPLLEAMRKADGKFELVLRRQRRSVAQLSAKGTSPRSAQGLSPGRSLGQHQSQTVSSLGPSVSQRDLAATAQPTGATGASAVTAETATPAAQAPTAATATATASATAAASASAESGAAPKAGPMSFMSRLKKKLR